MLAAVLPVRGRRLALASSFGLSSRAEVHGPLVRPPVFKTGVGRESVSGRFDSCAFPFLCERGVTDEASRILDAAMKLPSAERAELAAILTDSIGDGSSPDQVQAAWLEEAKRRLAAYERGELQSVDFEDMMRRLRAKDRRPRPRQASVG